MKEIEVKVLNIDRGKVELDLLQLGATKVFDNDLEAFFFDFKDTSISNAQSVIRLRREGKQVMFTFKTVMGNQGAKIAEEYSVEVSDLVEMQKILQSLGLTVTASTQKHRVSYQLEQVHFDFDSYHGEHGDIPEFMEIEARNILEIHKYATLLGFKIEECLPWSINDLIKHYSSEKP
jgi:adenylate cyclase class 2